MPMIDVYATGGTFANPRALARDLASTLMKIEQVPDIPMFRNNTAAFIHDLPDGALSNVEGDGNYVRVQVLTNAGALNRDKQLAVVRQLTDLVAVQQHVDLRADRRDPHRRPTDLRERGPDRRLGEELRQEDHGCLHHPWPLGPLARPRAPSPALPRGSRVRGSGGCSSRCLGGGVQQEEQVLDVALPGRTPRDARGARGAEH